MDLSTEGARRHEVSAEIVGLAHSHLDLAEHALTLFMSCPLNDTAKDALLDIAIAHSRQGHDLLKHSN